MPASRRPASRRPTRNAAIAAVLLTEKAEVKLSPDVEVQARRLGRAAGEKVVAYARDRAGSPRRRPPRPPEEPVKLPEPKPAQKPEKKPGA